MNNNNLCSMGHKCHLIISKFSNSLINHKDKCFNNLDKINKWSNNSHKSNNSNTINDNSGNLSCK